MEDEGKQKLFSIQKQYNAAELVIPQKIKKDNSKFCQLKRK